MKINVKHILEGIGNSIFVKDEVEKIAKARQAICAVCPKNSDNVGMGDTGPHYNSTIAKIHTYCTMCACNLHAKVRSLHTSCPIEKWEAVATVQEAAKIAYIIDDQNPK